MKAIVQDRYGDVDALQLRDIAEPYLEDDEVLIRAKAGLDPGVWHLMTARPYLVRVIGFGLRKQPRGMDVAGIIEKVAAFGLDPG